MRLRNSAPRRTPANSDRWGIGLVNDTLSVEPFLETQGSNPYSQRSSSLDGSNDKGLALHGDVVVEFAHTDRANAYSKNGETCLIDQQDLKALLVKRHDS